MSPYLSIVIPAYNEAHRLPPTLEQLGAFCRDAIWPVEVMIVVEGSTDGTLDIAREYARQQEQSVHRFRAIDNGPQRGKGHAVRSGMLKTEGSLVFYMDVDLSVPLRDIYAFVSRFEHDPSVDVLAGNRQHAQSRITLAQGWLRRSMGQIFNRIISTLAMADLRDTQCGFKAFRRDAARRIFGLQQLNGFAFDVEVLLLAHKLGFRVDDMPVEWINSEESKVHIIRDSLRMLRDVLLLRSMAGRWSGTRADAVPKEERPSSAPAREVSTSPSMRS
ncbi:dolichyl-phosphate beta-glucosyltransferase [Verrucomicrobiota bacterium sgz303538]